MSMNFRGRLLAATLCAGALGAALPAGAETLADAIALAYQNNPTLQAQRASQRALDESYVQARSGWRPTLNLAASAGYNETRIPFRAAGGGTDRNGDGIPDFVPRFGIFETNSSRATLTFNQPLWTGGRVAADGHGAHADLARPAAGCGEGHCRYWRFSGLAMSRYSDVTASAMRRRNTM